MHGSTTCPSSSSRGATGPALTLRLRWVFPEPKALDLVGRKVVGRDPTCDCELSGKEVSRRHAEVCVDGPMVAFADLRSRNGVFVNGKRRDSGPIGPGDVIRCGEWVGVVTAEADELGFREVAPGWFGGATLHCSLLEARKVPTELPIVIQGETGTGKECTARAIHSASGRGGEFVAVNCAALPDHLVESQLFGHCRGAFTGADKASVGYFRAAHGGTLFLDEIQELPITIQPKLLRAIERCEVVPVGEVRAIPIDARILAASQEPLHTLVAEGRFRADLQARLDGLTLELPPLRNRREDVAPLFLEFLRQQALVPCPTIDPRLIEALCTYGWPLNVRELLLLTRRLAALHGSEPKLFREHLPSRLLECTSAAPSPTERPSAPRVKRSWRPVDDGSEFEALVQALKQHRGNVSRAAASIGINRARAYRLLSAHPEFSTEEA